MIIFPDRYFLSWPWLCLYTYGYTYLQHVPLYSYVSLLVWIADQYTYLELPATALFSYIALLVGTHIYKYIYINSTLYIFLIFSCFTYIYYGVYTVPWYINVTSIEYKLSILSLFIIASNDMQTNILTWNYLQQLYTAI